MEGRRKEEGERDRRTQKGVEEERGWGPRREEGGGKEDEEEGPLLQSSVELRNPHRLGLVTGCARRSAPAPVTNGRGGGVASMGVESRRALRRCSNRGPLSEDLSLLFRAATLPCSLSEPARPSQRIRDAFTDSSSVLAAAMATKIDKEACRAAYNLVRDDGSAVIW